MIRRETEDALNKGLQISRTIGDTYYLPRALDALAQLKEKTGHLEQAHSLYTQAEDAIDGMLLRFPGAYSESSLLSTMSDTYLDDFELSAKQDDVSAAFDAIERARGRSILDNMRSKANQTADSPANSVVQQQISRIQSQLLDSNDPAARATLLESLTEEEYKLGYIDEALSSEQRSVTTHPVALKTAQASLSNDEAILEYVLADPTSYCLALTRSASAVVRLRAGRKQIEELTSQYVADVMQGKSGTQEAEELYGLLLKPIPESLRLTRLVIIPDGSLHNVPFDALVAPDSEYVLQSHTVSYAPSATVLDFLRNRQRADQPQMAFLGVGDVPYDMEGQADGSGATGGVVQTVSRGVYDISGAHLYPLPETRAELISAKRAENSESTCERPGRLAECVLAEVRVNVAKVWMVENIECFGAELQLQVLVDWKVPPNGQIHLPSSKAADEIAGGVAQAGGRGGESTGINRAASRAYFARSEIVQSLKNGSAVCAVKIDRLAGHEV